MQSNPHPHYNHRANVTLAVEAVVSLYLEEEEYMHFKQHRQRYSQTIKLARVNGLSSKGELSESKRFPSHSVHHHFLRFFVTLLLGTTDAVTILLVAVVLLASAEMMMIMTLSPLLIESPCTIVPA